MSKMMLLVDGSVRELVHHGNRVIVESGAGAGIGFDDDAYAKAGAMIASGAAEVFAKAVNPWRFPPEAASAGETFGISSRRAKLGPAGFDDTFEPDIKAGIGEANAVLAEPAIS